MEDVAAMVAEAIARRVKAAQAAQQQTVEAAQSRAEGALRQRAAAGDAQAKAVVAQIDAARAKVARGAVPSSPAAAPAPPPIAMPSVAPSDRDTDSTSLPGLPTTILEAASVEAPMLLAAFTPDGILPAIILAEALAKPLALREGGSGYSF